MPVMKLKVMGRPRVWIDDTEVTKEFSKKALALLIYVIFSPDCSMSREKIMTMLWGESDEKAARYNLRHNLWKIRRVMRNNALNDAVLWSDNYLVRFTNLECIQVDAFELIEIHEMGKAGGWELEKHQIDKLLISYKENFFDHFYLSDCEAFNDWLYYQKEAFQKIYIESLTEIAAVHEKRNALDVAIELYKELTGFMPYDDAVHKHLISNLMASGDYINAIHYYELHKKRLRVDLNMSPSKSLQDMIENHNQDKHVKNSKSKGLGDRIVLERYALSDVPYMALSTVIDSIIDKYEASVLLKLDPYVWGDLCRINGNIRKFLNVKQYESGFLTESSERIRLFKAMYSLLNFFHTHHNLVLDFKLLSKIDSCSEEFFSNMYKTDQGSIMKNWL